MNVTELARKLKITTEQLKDELPKLGFDIGRRAIKIDEVVAEKVIKLWSERRRSQVDSQYVVVEKKLNQVAVPASIREVSIPTILTPREFAALLGYPVTTIVGELFKNGIMASINERIDYETACIIAQDLGFVTKPAEIVSDSAIEAVKAITLTDLLQNTDDSKLSERPPVVVVIDRKSVV